MEYGGDGGGGGFMVGGAGEMRSGGFIEIADVDASSE